MMVWMGWNSYKREIFIELESEIYSIGFFNFFICRLSQCFIVARQIRLVVVQPCERVN
jgi:hypothetical protein